MFNFISKFFDYNQKEINRIRKRVGEINALEDKARKLKDENFSKETEKLKKLIRSKEKTLEDVLPWSFALVREASRRILGKRHFDVQLIAGIALHEGKIAEQKTGEGKTLTATTALYLNALSGEGTHLVTVNDYLARLHAGWNGPVFGFLGLTTSAIIADQSFVYDEKFSDKQAQDWRLSRLKPVSRKEAYLADVTYGINSEFGFDYLRDNMANNPEETVQRGFNYAIIDEADSVLIDEARTPHIISAPFDEETSKYYRYAQIVKTLDPKEDYVIDEKSRTANLTEAGIVKIESMIGVSNIYEKDFETLFHIEAALKAETLFHNNKEYIVKDGEVVIVDEFTGRLLAGRRFSEGIHQAIEAKENVSIQRESKTLATVSLQNYFRMYKKLAGMTGTAATEAEEFHKIYKTDVLVVPTHMSMVRKDRADMIYKTEKAKFDAVVEEIAREYKKSRPVLVGTTSIEKNEYLSQLLNKRGIPHELLNAKNHEREAHIIAQAGRKGAVTVATNMAGRGVDIILGGMIPEEEKDKKVLGEWQKEHDEVIGLGGLQVIGTERHESRRIDNQLRGRAGRQGDPGETRFFVSLEDDLMRIFGGEQIARLMTMFNFPEDQALTHPMVSRAIEQAQVKVEGFNFDIRKHLVDYDDVLNKQREIIYSLRKKILFAPLFSGEELRETILDVFDEEIQDLVSGHFFEGANLQEDLVDKFIREVNFILAIDKAKINGFVRKNDIEGLILFITDAVEKEFISREKKFGQENWLNIAKIIFLNTIDTYWTGHLTAIEDLREGINLRGYAQMDPLVEYKNEAFSMFEKLIGDINFEVTRRLFKIEVQVTQSQEETDRSDGASKKAKPIVYKSASAIDPFTQPPPAVEKSQIPNPLPADASHQAMQAGKPQVNSNFQNENNQINNELGFRVIAPGTKKRQLGRNDPCWCGSGKKYKKCHLNSDLG